MILLLRSRGIYAWRNQSTGVWDVTAKRFRSLTGGAIKGVADILGILPDGRFLAIEAKTPVGKASPEQVTFINSINKNGGVAFFARHPKELMWLFDSP